MNKSKDGIYFMVKMEKGEIVLKLSIVKAGKKVFPSIEIDPSEKDIRRLFDLFNDILSQANLEGGSKNRIIKFLDGGIGEFLSDK